VIQNTSSLNNKLFQVQKNFEIEATEDLHLPIDLFFNESEIKEDENSLILASNREQRLQQL